MEQVTPKAQPYVEALKKLARNGHASSILESSPLLDLEVVARAAAPGASPQAKADIFVEILEHVIMTRLKGAEQRKAAALFAYGEYAGVPLQDRYHAAARAHDPDRGNWEKFRKEPLTDFLITVLTALDREAASRAAPSSETIHSTASRDSVDASSDRRPVIGGAFSVVNYEVFYNFPSQPGMPRETVEMREIRAGKDGLDHWQMSSQYRGKNPDQAPTLTLFGPGVVETVHDLRLTGSSVPGRAYLTRVNFPRKLAKGETIRFGIVRKHDVQFGDLVRPDWRDQRDITPIVPVDHAQIGVRFPTDHRPRVVWHFEDLPDYLSPGAPDSTNQLQADKYGYVVFDWCDLMIGHSYGLAWRW